MTTAQLRELAEHVAFTEHWWILDWAADHIDELERECARLKRRVNELAEIVRDFAASAEYAEAEGINTEPEA